MKLGDRLRQARENSMLSQTRVKELTKINNKTISNYENNISSPDPSTLKILADLYGVTTDWLISGKYDSKNVSNKDLGFLRDYNNLPPDKKEIVDTVIKISKTSKDDTSATAGK